MSRFSFIAAATLAAASALAPLGAAQARTPNDTLIQAARIDDVVTLDPAELFEISTTEYAAQVYDRLVRYEAGSNARLLPGIATAWTISDEGRVFTFKIREGVTFHSGNPLTAHDVAYSLQRVVKLKLAPSFILTQFGINADNADARIQAPDATTLRFEISDAYAPTFVLYALTSSVTSVVDSKLVEKHATNGDFGHQWLRQHSAGSGPYKLNTFRQHQFLSYDANPDYWEGKPGFKRVFTRHVPEGATQQLMLEKGDIDLARNLSSEQLVAVAKNPDVQVSQLQRGHILYLGLNTQRAPFAKVEVRQALKYLVDYQAMADSFMKGKGVVHQSFLPRGYLGALEDQPFSLNVERAKTLLAQAGYPDGFKITMDVANISPNLDIAQAVQATFAQAGIQVELIPADSAQTLTRYRARNHDIHIGTWGPDYRDPHTNADTFASNPDNSAGAPAKTLAWRNAWDIPALTEATRAALREPDADQRRARYEALQQTHRDTAPFIPMFQLVEAIGVRTAVKGLANDPAADTLFYWKGSK